MRLTEAAVPVFARHETFHPRYGWFRKAYGAAAEDPRVFDRDDAPIRIGVGKNMVRAIRFWGLAADLIDESSIRGQRAKRLVPTPFGDLLFGNPGWDPWMEDPGTLWLLHWRLLRSPCRLRSGGSRSTSSIPSSSPMTTWKRRSARNSTRTRTGRPRTIHR